MLRPAPGASLHPRFRARGSARRRGRSACHAVSRVAASIHSAVPDVLAPGLRCVFCGINPGRVSAAAAAHFANPRNDFWRLLHDAGFTPRRFDPASSSRCSSSGSGSPTPHLGRHPARAISADATSTPAGSSASRASSILAQSRSSGRRRIAASFVSARSPGRSSGRSGRPRCSYCRRRRRRMPRFRTRSACTGLRPFVNGSFRSTGRPFAV